MGHHPFDHIRLPFHVLDQSDGCLGLVLKPASAASWARVLIVVVLDTIVFTSSVTVLILYFLLFCDFWQLSLFGESLVSVSPPSLLYLILLPFSGFLSYRISLIGMRAFY